MLTIWNPFAPIVSKDAKSDRWMTSKDYFDRLFESTVNEFFSDLYPYRNLGIETKEQEDGTLTMYLDVPGLKEEDISVEVSDNILTIKGERKAKGSYYSLNKSFTIPKKYDIESLEADLADGVLSLTLNSKLQAEKTVKKIEVKSRKTLLENK